MGLLIRIFLISLVIFLLLRSFAQFFKGIGGAHHENEPERKRKNVKGVPREVGEYVDYEEVEK